MIPDLLFDTCLKLKFSNIYIFRPCLEKRKEEEDGLEGVGGRRRGIEEEEKTKAFRTLVLMRAAAKKVLRHLTVELNQGRCYLLGWKFCRHCLLSP